MTNCGDNILQIPGLLFLTKIDATKFFNSLMTSLDTEEYISQDDFIMIMVALLFFQH